MSVDSAVSVRGGLFNGQAALDANPVGGTTLRLASDLDIATVDQFRELVGEATRANGRASSSSPLPAPFCDVVGLGALLRVDRQLRSIGGLMTVSSPPPSLRRLLDVFDLGPSFAG